MAGRGGLVKENACCTVHCARAQAWLNAKVHKVGSLHASADELLVAVTGLPLDPRFFLEYLRAKYTELYKL